MHNHSVRYQSHHLNHCRLPHVLLSSIIPYLSSLSCSAYSIPIKVCLSLKRNQAKQDAELPSKEYIVALLKEYFNNNIGALPTWYGKSADIYQDFLELLFCKCCLLLLLLLVSILMRNKHNVLHMEIQAIAIPFSKLITYGRHVSSCDSKET